LNQSCSENLEKSFGRSSIISGTVCKVDARQGIARNAEPIWAPRDLRERKVSPHVVVDFGGLALAGYEVERAQERAGRATS
jgi:hypothetical protein